QDLYYRLAIFTIRIPVLAERGNDVTLLAEHFLARFRRELKKTRLKLSAAALAALRAHSWPGNVRELQNVIERAAILADGELMPADLALPPPAKAAAATVSGAGEERNKLEAALRECNWNKRAAAERLGISYKSLLQKLHVHDLA